MTISLTRRQATSALFGLGLADGALAQGGPADKTLVVGMPSIIQHLNPAIGVHRTWISSNIRQGVPFSNTQGYVNPKVDDLFARAIVERDEARRKALYAEFQRILSQDVPVAFTHVWSRKLVVRNELAEVPEGIWGGAVPYDRIHFKA